MITNQFMSITASNYPHVYMIDHIQRCCFTINFIGNGASSITYVCQSITNYLLNNLDIEDFTLSLNENIFIGSVATIPDSEGPIIQVLDSPGMSATVTMTSKRDNVGFQIIVRSTDYELGLRLSTGIYELLDNAHDITIDINVT